MQRIRKNLKTVVTTVATILLLFVVGTLHAQGNAGAISGTVIDPTGAALPGATVTVTNQATGVSSTLTTNDSGFYSAEALYAGVYTVRISSAGFKESITHGIQIDPGERRANNVQLDVGSANTQVTVTADAAQINTETSESAGTVTATQVSNLMLNGRNFQTLALVIPGVSSVLAGDSNTSQSTYLIVNGMGTEYTTYTIDGVYDMNSGNLSAIDIVPVLDGISEFRVLKDNYSAKYGSAGGGQVVVNTISGTETFHGTAWDYLRNNAFDASNFFSTTSQRLQQNIYGFTLGGPVIIPKVYNTDRSKKTFFFAALQWHAINSGAVQTGAMFPQAMRNGDFSASSTLTGNLTLDSSSATLLAAQGKTNCIAGPKTLNPACFNPVAVALMNAYMPLPNNLPAGFNNYINQSTIYTREHEYQFRVDHSINSYNTVAARMMYQNTPIRYPYSYMSGAPSNLITYDTSTADWNNLVRLTSTITPRLVNAMSLASTENRGAKNVLGPGATAGLMPAGVTITQAFPGADSHNRIPNITFSKGWSSMGVGAAPTTASDGEGIAADDVTWVKGTHVLQAGAMYIFGIKRQREKTLPQGAFSFSGAHTGDPAADYLLGLDATYSQVNTQLYGNFHYRQGEAYVQDDWKASRRLMLNLGLRWQYFSNDTESGDQVTSFSPAAYSAVQAPVVNLNGTLKVNSLNEPVNSLGGVANLVNGLIFAGQNGVPSGFFIPTKKNFGPRVGFAYDLRGNGRSSLRGGYGIGYSRIPVEQVYNAFGTNPPYNVSANIVNSLLSDGVAGTAAAPTTQTLASVPLTFMPSQVQTFSLTLEQEIGSNTVATIGYAGSLGHHLMSFQGGYDSNFPLPVTAPSTSNCLATGQAASSSYDFDPCINKGTVSSSFTRPYQGYAVMLDEYDEGSSNFNSLQSGLTYNAGRSRFNISYTYSKSLGTIGATGAGSATTQGTVAQNPRHYAAEYGPPAFDFTHNIAGTWVYNIPNFAHSNKLAGYVIGGWSFAGLGVHQSGAAMSLSMSTGKNGEAIRPDEVAPYRKVGKLSEWFDTTSFAAPLYGFFGNSRNGIARGPAYTSFNTALYKTLPVTERFRVEIRAEAFNVANHPSFESISSGLGAGNFGAVTSAHNPRNLEFALKLMY